MATPKTPTKGTILLVSLLVVVGYCLLACHQVECRSSAAAAATFDHDADDADADIEDDTTDVSFPATERPASKKGRRCWFPKKKRPEEEAANSTHRSTTTTARATSTSASTSTSTTRRFNNYRPQQESPPSKGPDTVDPDPGEDFPPTPAPVPDEPPPPPPPLTDPETSTSTSTTTTTTSTTTTRAPITTPEPFSGEGPAPAPPPARPTSRPPPPLPPSPPGSGSGASGDTSGGLPCGVGKVWSRRRREEFLREPKFARTNNNASLRVVGGESALPGELPYNVWFFANKDGLGKLLCSGALISNRHILTRAFCILGDPLQPDTALNDINYFIGDFSMKTRNDGQLVLRSKSVQIYPLFKSAPGAQPNTIYSTDDLAIVTLAKPVNFVIHKKGYGSVNRVCLPPANLVYPAEDKLTVSGWGFHSIKSKAYSDILQKASFTSKVYQIWPYTKVFQPYGVGACVGDNSAPLVRWVRGPGGREQAELVGLAYNTACGQGDLQSYIPVSNYIDWINSVMAES